MTSYSPGKGIFYRYGRSAAGDLLNDTDPLGHRRYARYDELGRLISQTSQNGHTRTLRYQGSLLSEIIDFNGHSTHYSYDDYNRMIQERYERGTEVSYRYDAVGNLLEAAGEEGNRLFYEYDELNRLIRETDDRFSSDIGFRYDERGNKTHVLRDGIIREVYTYGQRGELLSVSDEENQDIRFEYDVMGRETLRQFPGGVEQRRIYDDWGRPAGVSAYRETGSMRYDFLWGEGYVYNSGGQRSRIVRHTGKVREFEYDDMDRLARVSYPFSDEILIKSYRDRLDAGLFPQQRSPGGDSFIQYLLNFDPGEVILKADIMKLVSDKSKVYPELFDPALSSAYYFSPGEGALNQFRTLKNSGDAEVLAIWKEIAPPGTQRAHFSGGYRLESHGRANPNRHHPHAAGK